MTMELLNKLEYCVGFPGGADGKAAVCSAGDLGSIPGLGRSPGEGKGYPLQYSGLENSMDCIDHGVANSQILLGDFHSFMFCFISCPILCVKVTIKFSKGLINLNYKKLLISINLWSKHKSGIWNSDS